ncbi:MAG: fibronectin type III domain-containing protein [Acidobacterium ailaaui]|nr:fibronectin type III domain-containing protein [Pseudacidobacterium ailaaui]
MKKFYLSFILILGISISFSASQLHAQVLNPNDSVITYDSNHPPTLPPWDSIGKWVRTVRMNWNTNQYKCYIYRNMAFRLLFPKTWTDTSTKKYPMVIFLHGLGEKGTIYDNETQLKWEGQRFLNAVNNGEFDGFVLYPQSQGGFWGQSEFDKLVNIINYMTLNAKLDINRVYLSGLSAGGSGDWDFLTAYPNYFACAEIISASSTLLLAHVNTIYKYIPIWISQGQLDGNPSPYTTQLVVDSLKSVGAPITYTVYPNVGHGVWDLHYAEPDAFPYYNRANKVNPVVFFGQTLFCPEDTANNIHVTLGLQPGFDGYQWRKNGVVLPDTGNTLLVTSLGTYDARIKRGNTWSYWSPTPVVIGVKPPTQTPNIQVAPNMSAVIPAPDGHTSVTLTLPSGYVSYTWKKYGTDSVVSTQQNFTTSTPGKYVALVTEAGGCSSLPSAPFTVINANGPNPPDPASNPIAIALSQTKVQLSWSQKPNPVYNETGFEIYRSLQKDTGYQLIAINPADSTVFIDSTVSPNTTYYYRIRAVDSTAASTTTAPVSVTTLSDHIPPTPPALQLVNITLNSISIKWSGATDNVGVVKYWIYVNGVKSYVSTDTSFILTNLQHDSTYSIQVKALDAAGNVSSPSNQLTAIPRYYGLTYNFYTYTGSWSSLPNLSNMQPVFSGTSTNFSLSPATQSTNYAFAWNGYIHIPYSGTYTFYTNSDDGSQLFISNTLVVNNDGLHSATEKSGTYTFNQPGWYPITVWYYQQTGGASLTVSWAKSSGTGSFAKSAIPDSAFMESVSPSGALPAAPNNILATALSYRSIKVQWQDNSNNETGFEIYRATSLGGPYSIVFTAPANTTQFIDSTLQPTTTYYYKVQAINNNGASGFNLADLSGLQYKYYTTTSAWSSLPNFDSLKPVSTGTVNNVTLSPATQSTNYGFVWTGYIRIPTTGSYTFWTYSDDGSKLYIDTPYRSTATALVNNDGLHGMTYKSGTVNLTAGRHLITITYFQAGGGSGMQILWGPSNNRKLIPDSVFANPNMYATTLAAPAIPAIPTQVIATANNPNQITLSWHADTGSTRFRIYRAVGDTINFQLLAFVNGNGLTQSYQFVDTGLYANTLYAYRIAAENIIGQDAGYSSWDTAMTGNHAPKILQPASSNQYQLINPNTVSQIPVKATDADGDPLTLGVLNLPSFGSFQDNGDGTGVITFTNPTMNQRGPYPGIKITVHDNHGGTDTSIMNLAVNDIYAATPVIQNQITMNVATIVNDTLNANIPTPRDYVYFAVSPMLPFMKLDTINGRQAVLHLKPGYGDAGNYTISVTVTDKYGLQSSAFFTLKVNYVDPNKNYYLNFSYQTLAPSPWNNITSPQISNIKDDQGNTSSIGFHLNPAVWNTANLGANTGNNSGIYPDVVINECYYIGSYFGAPDSVEGVFTGLNPSRTYNITFFSSSVWNWVSDNGYTLFRIGNKIDSIYVQNNINRTIIFSNLTPQPDSTIHFTVIKQQNRRLGFLNAIVLHAVYNDGQPPLKPSNLTVRTGNNANILSWVTNAYNTAKGFEIYRKGPADTGFILLNPNPTNSEDTTFTDPNVHGNSTYAYTIRAVNQHGYSGFSDTVFITTAAINPIINGIPNNLVLPYGSSDTLNFTGVADDIDSIKFTGVNLPAFVTLIDSGNNKGSLIIAPSFQNDIGSYSFTIAAITNHGGKSSTTMNVQVNNKYFRTILVNVTNAYSLAPSPWNNLANWAFGNTTIPLVDNTNTTTGYSITNADTWTGSGTTGLNTTNNSGIFPDTVIQSYYYQSDTSTRHLILSGLDRSKRYNFIFYNNNIYSNESSNYKNYTTIFKIGNQIDSLNAYLNVSNTAEINGIIPDSTGKITILVNKGFNSEYAILNAIIIEEYDSSSNLILPPTDLQARVSPSNSGKIVLTWKDQAWNETGYTVWRSLSKNGTYTLIANLPANKRSYVDSIVAGNTRYFYKVRAINQNSVSEFSNIASVTTPSYTVYINVNTRYGDAPSPWNNLDTYPNDGNFITGFKDENGNLTNISLHTVKDFSGESNIGLVTGNNSGVFPDVVIYDEYFLDLNDTMIYVFSGLNLTMKYNFIFFGSIVGFGWDNTTIFMINNQKVALNTAYNYQNTVQINNVSPDQDGNIVVKIFYKPSARFGVLGAMVIQAYDDYDDNGQLKATQPGSPYMYLKMSNSILNTNQHVAIAYPNPFHNVIHVGIPVQKAGEDYQIRLMDVSGQIIYTRQLGTLPSGWNDILLDLSQQQLSDGMYLLNIQSNSGQRSQTLKLIRR